jgi:hypothetical protein
MDTSVIPPKPGICPASRQKEEDMDMRKNGITWIALPALLPGEHHMGNVGEREE